MVGAAVEDCVEGNDGVVPPNLKPPKITKQKQMKVLRVLLKIYNKQKKFLHLVVQNFIQVIANKSQ